MSFSIALIGLLAGTVSPAPAARSPELLLLGSPHLANHNRDIANIPIEDVRTLQRQREIEAVVDRLASFHPTRVAVEWRADRQSALDQRYSDYRAGGYVLSADEIDQIGLRLAARIGLDHVDAIDWNDAPPGSGSDYDFPAWAEAHGTDAEWQAFKSSGQEEADAESRLMTCTPLSAWYRRLNTPSYRRSSQRVYYDIARFGDQENNPGAAWVGTWYARNLRILDNLRRISRPGDRVLVIYGAGHGFLLDQQARESGAFHVVDTLAYLPRSRRDSWAHCPSWLPAGKPSALHTPEPKIAPSQRGPETPRS